MLVNHAADERRRRAVTRPLLFSTQMAFFLLSIHNEPADTGVMVEGDTSRKPGPSLRGILGFEGVGRTSEEISSPGSTSICPTIFVLDAVYRYLLS